MTTHAADPPTAPLGVPERLWTSAAMDGRAQHPPHIRIGNHIRYDPATVHAYYLATQTPTTGVG